MNKITKFESYSETIFHLNDDELSKKTIFVSISSYRDKYILNTVKSLFNNAKRPQNIYVSISIAEFKAISEEWVNELLDLNDSMDNLSVSIIDCDNKTTIGEIKKKADSKYNKQNYYMSVSSRSEFAPYWDDIMIKQFSDLQSVIEENIVITADPRYCLPHDDVVNGFVYFTNHKTKMSMQREEYDGARIPISGFNIFTDDPNMTQGHALEDKNYKLYNKLFDLSEANKNEEFLKNNKFVKFGNRKFIKNEYIAIASGFSSKFIFTDAKNYFRFNSTDTFIVDENQFNFISFINFVKNNVLLISYRFIPVYYVYNDYSGLISSEKSPGELYSLEEYNNSIGGETIYRYKENYVYNNEKIKSLLGVDWEENKFKLKTEIISNNMINAINSFISLYNFSTYENTLHWNKRC